MTSEQVSKGWVLYSAGGRRFGPMEEEELRHYFRAGMVKSVDRISAPSDYVRHPAVDIAVQLGETPPVGPPPAALDADAADPGAPAPVAATPIPMNATDAAPPAAPLVLDERAMKAIAAMQMELATAKKLEEKRSGFIGPVLIGVGLLVALLIGLQVLKRMTASPAKATTAAAGDANSGVLQPATPEAAAGASDASSDGQPMNSREQQFRAAFDRADLLARAGDWPGLQGHAKQWSATFPERYESWRYLAVAYANQGAYPEAIAAFQEVLKRNPNDAEARAQLADTYLSAKRYSDAVPIYERLVGENANNARTWNNYGNALHGLGQDAQAIVALENAVRLEPTLKVAWNNLAVIYQGQGEDAKAAAAAANAR